MDEYSLQNVPLNRNKHSHGAEKKQLANRFIDRLLRSVFVTSLFAIDLALFIYSINGKLIENGIVNQAYVAICGGLFLFFAILMFAVSFSQNVQNAICGIVVLLVTVMYYSQFALFNTDTFIELWLNEHASWLSFIGFIPALWLVGLFFGTIVFFLFRFRMAIVLITVATLFGGGVYVSKIEIQPSHKTEYISFKEYKAKGDAKTEDSLIYIMAPKFPSYQFFNLVTNDNFKELRDLVIGFYAVNNFEIYPNAFIHKNDTMSNLIDLHNLVDYISTSSGDRKYAEIINKWNFRHDTLEILALEESRLYDALKQKGFAISTYPMPGFNLCYKKEDIYSDRCMVKAPKILKLYEDKSPLDNNVFALIGEWILSLNSRDLKSTAKMFLDMSFLKGRKIISENRRTSFEGSPTLFEHLKQDYMTDGTGMAYMAYVDLPSDIYMYDEFCRLKPENKWIALKDSPVTNGGIDDKRQAYTEQAKCLIGLMQMYLDTIAQSDKFAKTDVIVQGVSTIRELAGMPAGQYGNFVADKLVSLGIRHKGNPKFSLNGNICLVSDFTRSYLLDGEPSCYTIDHMKMSREDARDLKQSLFSNAVLRGNRIAALSANYQDWYEEFKKHTPFLKNDAEQEQVADTSHDNLVVKETEMETTIKKDTTEIDKESKIINKPEIQDTQKENQSATEDGFDLFSGDVSEHEPDIDISE